MAFASTGWQPGVNHLAGRLRGHHYVSADALATIVGSAYFNPVVKDLVQGDIILLTAAAFTAVAQIAVTSATGVTPVTTVQAP